MSFPYSNIWSSYDSEADVLYLNFNNTGVATDSEMLDDNILIRYENEDIIGITIISASKLMNNYPN